MYFFYFDESGSRDPSVGTETRPKDHIYVLLAMGMYEGRWKAFERDVSFLKLQLADELYKRGKGRFALSDCEVKSTWIRNPRGRARESPFLDSLEKEDRQRLVDTYFRQVGERNVVLMAVVVDKRYLHDYVTHELLHKKAYELVLERIQHYMREYHRKHRAVMVMDDTSKQLNQAVAMQHARFQRVGNQNMMFPAVVEYPFFTRSELSNGVQLADLLAYNVYRAFRDEDLGYSYFQELLPHFYRRPVGGALAGLKVWPPDSPLVALAQEAETARG